MNFRACEGLLMQPAYWWFTATIFAITALYFYWTRKRNRCDPGSPTPDSV